MPDTIKIMHAFHATHLIFYLAGPVYKGTKKMTLQIGKNASWISVRNLSKTHFFSLSYQAFLLAFLAVYGLGMIAVGGANLCKPSPPDVTDGTGSASTDSDLNAGIMNTNVHYKGLNQWKADGKRKISTSYIIILLSLSQQNHKKSSTVKSPIKDVMRIQKEMARKIKGITDIIIVSHSQQ